MSKEVLTAAKTLQTNEFFFVAGNLSLDFINTQIIEDKAPKDLLAGFSDFATWAAAANLLEKRKAEKLIDDWSEQSESATIFAEALNFRSILREMYARLAQGKAVKKLAITAINNKIKDQSGAIEIRQIAAGFEKLFRADFRDPRQLLAPIAESAADLLCYGNLANLRKCENHDCILYFYDTTKNHTRRWCSMAGCGNRAKAAAFYQRQRSQIERKK